MTTPGLPTPEQAAIALQEILNAAQRGQAAHMHQVLATLNAPSPTESSEQELSNKLLTIGRNLASQIATTPNIVTLLAQFHAQLGDDALAITLLDQLLGQQEYTPARLAAGAIAVRHRDIDKAVFHAEKLAQILEQKASAGNLAGAFDLQRYIYFRIARAYEDEDFVYRVMHPVHQIMDRGGRRFAEKNGVFTGAPARNGRHRIAFLFASGTLLAHSEVALMMCAGLAQSGEGIIEPVIYCFGNCDTSFADAFGAVGVKFIRFPASGQWKPAVFGQMMQLRHVLAAEGIDTAIWVSVPTDANFYFGYRVAPRQVYWSMKFHTLITPGVDHLVSCGSWAETEKTVHNHRWVIGSVAFADPLRGADLEAAARVRAEFAHFQPLLGVLAREEKINSRPYLEAVARILEEHPTAGFVWTGRSEHPVIRDFFANRGLSARAKWVGWVNTATYIHALDIFLETFPFGCGMTSTQALAAGKPVISYRDWTTVMGHHFAPVLESRAGTPEMQRDLRQLFTGRRGDSLFLMADDVDQYVEMARRVIADPDLREDLSVLGKTLVERYLGNSRMAARRFGEIFREIDSGPWRM